MVIVSLQRKKLCEKTKEETAKKMLQDNLDSNIISKYTDLSIDEVEKLKKEVIYFFLL